jgi:hypothetical protein
VAQDTGSMIRVQLLSVGWKLFQRPRRRLQGMFENESYKENMNLGGRANRRVNFVRCTVQQILLLRSDQRA